MNEFKVRKEEVNKELLNRLAESSKEYNFQLNLFNNQINIQNNSSEIIFSQISNESLSEVLNVNNNTVRCKIFKYNKFSRCDFEGLEFTSCLFIGNDFNDCTFINTRFVNCTFYNSKKVFNIINGGIFTKCNIVNTNCDYIIFKGCTIKKSTFENTSLRNAIIDRTSINKVTIKDCDLKYFKVVNTMLKELIIEDISLSKVNDYTFFDVPEMKIKDKEEIKKIFRSYKEISTLFQKNGFLNYSAEYYYVFKKIEKNYLKGLDKFKSIVYWMICGYGERPIYALITSMEIILLFGVLYMVTGINIDSHTINYTINSLFEIPFEIIISDFIQALYFSIVTFTTVGYGDITPIGSSIFLCIIEMFLGVTMVGVWTATLARKITR